MEPTVVKCGPKCDPDPERDAIPPLPPPKGMVSEKDESIAGRTLPTDERCCCCWPDEWPNGDGSGTDGLCSIDDVADDEARCCLICTVAETVVSPTLLAIMP